MLQKSRYILFLFMFMLYMSCCPDNSVKPPPDAPREQWGLIPFRTGNEWVYEAYVIDRETADLIRRYTWGDYCIGIVGDTVSNLDGMEYDAFAWAHKNMTTGAVTDYRWLYSNDEQGLWCLGGISSNDTLMNRTLLYKYPIRKGESFPVPCLTYHLYEHKWNYTDTLTFTCVDDSAWFHTETDSFLCVVYNYKREQAEDVSEWLDAYEYFHPGIGCVGKIIKSYFPSTGRNCFKYKHILANSVVLNGQE